MANIIESDSKVTRINMACPTLDPRSGSRCGQCLGNKMTSYILGYLQTVLWVLCFVGLISQSSSAQTIEIVVGVIMGLFLLVFAILLVVGLHKDRRSYIKGYLIFCAVMTIVLILGFFVTLFTQPGKLGFRGFISNLIMISINFITFIAVRAYYLATYS